MSKRILVIQTAFLGDAILTLPMIQKLKEKFTSSTIDVIAIPTTKEIFEASRSVDNVIILDKRNAHKTLISLYSFSKKLRANNYTKIYSPHRSFRTALIVWLLGVDESYGFSNSSLKFVYTNLIPYDKNTHEVKRNLQLIEPNVNDDWRIKPVVEINQHSKEKISDFLDTISFKKFAAIAPGSVWKTKQYPRENFQKIIDDLVDKEYTVLLIGGSRDSELCNTLVAEFKNEIISTAGKFSVIESIHLLSFCEFLVCNDSAPTHFAMCADIPVIAIYCSTIKDFGFFPYNQKSFSVSYDKLDCKPCGIHGHKKCPIKTFDCGYKLVPEKIIEIIENNFISN